jgi:hypothetical protein
MSGTPSRFYLFCRFWPGFSLDFPFDRFLSETSSNELIRRVGEFVRAALAADSHAQATWRIWLTQRCASAEHQAAVNEYLDRCLKNPDFPSPPGGRVPNCELPLIEEDFGYALWALGWGRFFGAVSLTAIAGMHAIAIADSQSDAREVAEELNRTWAHNGSTPRFWVAPVESFDMVTRARYELQIDELRQACGTGDYGTLIASSAEALRWLSKMAEIRAASSAPSLGPRDLAPIVEADGARDGSQVLAVEQPSTTTLSAPGAEPSEQVNQPANAPRVEKAVSYLTQARQNVPSLAQKKPSAAWSEVKRLMIKDGAEIKPSSKETWLRYLREGGIE